MPSNNPAVLQSLMPMANASGSSVAVPPMSIPTGSPSVGGNANPFLPTPTGGQSMPPMTSPLTPTGATAGLGGANDYKDLFGGSQSEKGLIKGLEKAGYPGGIAALLAEFLRSGAGFNPQVAQALIAAMQPQM